MNILILNWRDVKNPSSGGAEKLTHELAKSWVSSGNQVVLLTSVFRHCLKEEIIDGVRIIRRGLWWNTQLYAFLYYLRHRKAIDLIIDEVHWFPYFSKLYAPRKTVLLACEVATKLFSHIFPSLISTIFKLLESLYFFIYKGGKVLTISASTKEDLLKRGFKANNVHVMDLGISIKKTISHFPKENIPTLISVGRLTKWKGIHDVINSFIILQKKHHNISLWIVGRGDSHYSQELKALVKSAGLQKKIIFFGFVSESKKYELLSRATIHVMASIQEGWGLVVSESFLCKTPTVAYNSSGLRDVISSGETGILTKNTPQALAEGINGLLESKFVYAKLQENAYNKASNFSWDNTANKALEFIMN